MPDLGAPPTHLDDSRLEEIMRVGLTARAALVQPTATAGHAAYARPRHHRARWVMAAAAVLLVAAGVPLGQNLLAGAPVAPGVTSHQATATTDPLTGAPAGYRYESYAGAEALVPVTWGLGGSPTKLGNGMCPQVSAYVAPGSTGLSGGLPLDIPYVGRPILMDVMCPASYARQTHPTVDALWFDSPFPVGTQEWPDGQVGQTVAAGWQTVTVFTSEASLRQRILASVRVVDHDSAGCPNEASSVPGAPVPARFTAQSLSVCMYGPNPYNRSESVPGGLTLSYSTVRGPAQASAYLAAVGDHPSASPVTKGCFQPAMTERVLIAVHGVQGSTHVTRWDDVVFMCGGGIHLGVGVPQQFAALDLSTVAPWAGDGSRAYVVGPWESTSPGVQTYFKGLMD